MSKSFSSDNFRKGKLYGKLMTGVILLFFVLLLGVVNASAIECPPGFKWVRMSGVGCVQENCMEIENAKLSYTSSCICIDGYKGCYESVDYTNFDKSKCGPNCPYSRLVACVKPGEPCPDQKTPPKIEDCMAYCRKYHGPHGLGTIKNGKCDCKCEKGYEPDKTLVCIPTKEQCNKDCIEYHGTDKIHGPEAYGKVVDGICNCYCKEGYTPDETLTCVKVKCPPNSTNVADLGSACPKDRILNHHCCCDKGYTPDEKTLMCVPKVHTFFCFTPLGSVKKEVKEGEPRRDCNYYCKQELGDNATGKAMGSGKYPNCCCDCQMGYDPSKTTRKCEESCASQCKKLYGWEAITEGGDPAGQCKCSCLYPMDRNTDKTQCVRKPRWISDGEDLKKFLLSRGYTAGNCPKTGDPPNGSVKFWSLAPYGGIKHSSVMLSNNRQIEMGHEGFGKTTIVSAILPPGEDPKPFPLAFGTPRKYTQNVSKSTPHGMLCPPSNSLRDMKRIEGMKGIARYGEDKKDNTKADNWNCHGFSAYLIYNYVETFMRVRPDTNINWDQVLEIGALHGYKPIVINIPQGQVRIRSEYTIEVRDDQTAVIHVIEGKADYKGIGHSLSLSSGQMGVIDPTGVPSAPTTFNISEMDQWWTELNYEGKGSSVPIPKPLEIVKLFAAKSVYPRGEKVDVHYHIKNTGTEDVEEYHVEYDIIDVTGKTVYRNVGGAHSISVGDENKWHSEKWEIPSNAEYGPCTIEARLKWDSETDTETTDFFVTQATRAKDKTAKLEITELYTSKFEYSRGEAIELCYRIKNVGTTDAEYHLCNIIEVEGEKGYWFILSTHSIAAGEEQKRCAAGCWKIPSDAKCGTYTIETILVWDSKTVKKETTFIVK